MACKQVKSEEKGELETAKCHCCTTTWERFAGRLICNLCSDAIKYEIRRSGNQISNEEAFNRRASLSESVVRFDNLIKTMLLHDCRKDDSQRSTPSTPGPCRKSDKGDTGKRDPPPPRRGEERCGTKRDPTAIDVLYAIVSNLLNKFEALEGRQTKIEVTLQELQEAIATKNKVGALVDNLKNMFIMPRNQ